MKLTIDAIIFYQRQSDRRFVHLNKSHVRVFENRILRRVFGPKMVENGEWRMLHNEEIHSLYLSPNIVRVINFRKLGWAGYIARMEESRNGIKILTDKPIGRTF